MCWVDYYYYCEETNMNRETFTEFGMLVGVVLFTENRAEGKLYGSTHVDEYMPT